MVWAYALARSPGSPTFLPFWQLPLLEIAGTKVEWLIGIVGATIAISGVGLLVFSSWGRWLTLIGASLPVLSIVGWISSMGPWLSLKEELFIALYMIPGMIWNGFVVSYLLRPGVKAQFVQSNRK